MYPRDGFDPKANESVYRTALQSDGKLLIGGAFTSLSPNGGPAVTRNHLARVNPDGRLDPSFNPNVNSFVKCIAVQADGKILIGGTFTSLSPNGGPAVMRNRIARLNKNGTLDASFNPTASSFVNTIAVQTDGKILIGGYFQTLAPNGGATVNRPRIARLNADGTVDTSFDPNANDGIFEIVIQADGKILVGGLFGGFSPNGGATVTRHLIARLNPSGTVDLSFDPNAKGKPELYGIDSIALQTDGKVLIGGLFNSLAPNGGQVVKRNSIARLNIDGTLDTSFDPNSNERISTIAVQPNGKILIGGSFTSLAPNGGAVITRNHIARLNRDGTVDSSFSPNVTASSGFPTVNSILVQADDKLVVAGAFNTVSSNGVGAVKRDNIARLYQDGGLDRTLNLELSVDDIVSTTAVQPNGKILIGGNFESVQGVTRKLVARLNPDGALGTSFNPNVSNSSISDEVMSIVVQPDGRIVFGGFFDKLAPNGGSPVKRNCVARLNADGTVDPSFNPNANSHVITLAIQPDGKILIGGNFKTLAPNGGPVVNRPFIARFNAGGTIDTSFDPQPNNAVGSIVVLADGKILIGGDFNSVSPNGGATIPRRWIALLNPDGTLDASFDPNPDIGPAAIAVQADGKMLMGGSFMTLSPNGGAQIARRFIARLNPDGTVDSFDPNPNNRIESLAVQTNGKILIAGEFTALSPNKGATVLRNHIARLNVDGTIDSSFDPDTNGRVRSVVIQDDGKILIAGWFTSLSPNGGNTVARQSLARLSSDTAAMQYLATTQTTIDWTRSGASPEVWRVTFEKSTDGGLNYTFLGHGSRVGTTSNFTLSGLNLPAGNNILIRARGFYRGQSKSESITQSVRLHP